MNATMVVSRILASAALVGSSPLPATAQSRVVVPIVIPAPPPAGSASARPPSIHVTTRTASPAPGVTTTRVTVSDTTGAGRTVGGPPGVRTLGTVPPGSPSVLVTIDRRQAPDGAGASGRTKIIVEDVSQANRATGGSAPAAALRTAGPGQQTVIITGDAPIDAPIVILGP